MNTSGKIKAAVSVLCFLLAIFVSNRALTYLVEDDTRSYTRIMMHEFYTQEDNIDILFVGASHCYKTANPVIMDEIFQKHTFNVGSSAQGMDGSYAMIKEADKYNDIETIYLETSFIMAQQPEVEDRTLLTHTYILSDYMRPSVNRVSFLLNASTPEHYVNSFFPAKRNWQMLLDPAYMRELTGKKREDFYRSYSYISNENEDYEGRGFVRSKQAITEGGFVSMKPYESVAETEISKDWENSLRDIIRYCDRKNLKLVLYSTPTSDFRLAATGDYDGYIAKMQEIIAGTDVKYYDFSLCKPEYVKWKDSYYADDNHLNGEGADWFSTLFAKFFTGQIKEQDLFYATYEEKLAAEDERIYGLITTVDWESSCIQIVPVANVDPERISYSYTRSSNEGVEEKGLFEAGEEPKISYPAGTAGAYEIVAYLDGTETNRVTILYGQ